MTGLGVFSWISGVLQLFVPSYGLRLVRRFGAQSVGWFLVAAFSCLALLHLVGPLKVPIGGSTSGIPAEAVYAFGAVLLLIGMGHLETVCSERYKVDSTQRRLREQAKEDTADLARTNRELRDELARREVAAKALQESAAQYRLLFVEHPQPMWIFDLRSSRFLAVNKAALHLYGFSEEEFMGLMVRDLFPAAAAASFLRSLVKPGIARDSVGCWQQYRKDRTLIEVEAITADLKYGGSSARLVLANDIGLRRQRETELLSAQKLEVVGQMAGGFAHHFNNLLAVIEGNASLLAQTPRDAESAQQLNYISTAVARGAGLTRQLLAVGGKNQVQLQPVDVNGVVRNLSHTLRRLVGEQISIQNVYGSGLPAAMADSQLVEQVVINLVLNARDAMPSGGTITISTTAVRREGVRVGGSALAGTGEFIRLSVRDTGCGISPETQAHLFEPFFTTKDIGQATGLGLASIHTAVRQQAGWIEFTTEVGNGTEFRIFLPCSRASAPTAGRATETSAALATILLVEPDDRLRGLARCALNWNGYRVVEADCVSTALMLWESQAAGIDLLLTDVLFPGGDSGCELAGKLRQSKPNLKMIFTSVGTPGENAAVDGIQIVSKPYRPEGLLRAVQSCLNS